MPTADEDRLRELERILELTRNEPYQAFQLVERQLGVLVLRTQVLLSLCGIVITVTGFSGRAIAQTSYLARVSISGGIAVVLLAAAVAIAGVLKLQWLTQLPGADTRACLLEGLRVRDRKSRLLGGALLLFVGGFSLYVFAIIQLLLAARPAG